MILLLQAGPIAVIAQNWSAGVNPGGRINVLAHGGTIGLKMPMEEFMEELHAALRGGSPIMDLRRHCGDPKETMERLAKGG